MPTRTRATCCVDSTGTIWLLDFGSVGRLDSLALSGLRGIALGFATQRRERARPRRPRSRRQRHERRPARARGRSRRPARRHRQRRRLRPGDDRSRPDDHAAARPAAARVDHAARTRAASRSRAPCACSNPASAWSRRARTLVRTHRDAFGTPREMLQHEVMRLLPALRTLPEHAEAIAGQLRSRRD